MPLAYAEASAKELYLFKSCIDIPMRITSCAFLISLLFSCVDLGSREIDWEKEWQYNSQKLKQLTLEVLSKSNTEYSIGNNDYPKNFEYPFDQGFRVDTSSIGTTITYYIDRGIMDHYSAFIYTNDSVKMASLNRQLLDRANDHLLEAHWYCIND